MIMLHSAPKFETFSFLSKIGHDICPIRVEIAEWIHQSSEQKASKDDFDVHFGLFVWPSARILTQFLARNLGILEGKIVLELGCGPALPTIFAARHGRLEHVRRA